MSNNTLLKQIGELIDKKLDTKLKPIKEQLNTVEMKVEVVNSHVNKMDKRLNSKIDKVKKELKETIDRNQEDTIQALSDLMHSGYDGHEKRIRRVEKHLDLPQLQE